MECFFNPKGIALVGATANPRKGGYAILNNLKAGFKGGIYPVNPRYQAIEGIPCYPSVADVPDPVDLAISFVPAKGVPAVIQGCADRGIQGVMIESGGFAEAGESGRAIQEEVAAIAQNAGIRLWGPNCMGLVDTINRYVFSFVTPTIWESLTPGNVSLVVQSGMLSGAFLIDLMTHATMGISKVCSIGNKMDVDECELLKYLMADRLTRVIGLYLESFPRGREFVSLCRRSEKPIVVLKGGKSRGGAAAAMSHTASLAGNHAVIAGALAQAGVIEASDFKELTDLCRALDYFPRIPASHEGGRIGIITYTGGAGIVSADFLEQHGLALAELSPQSRAAIQKVFPDWMAVANPVDLWPGVERYGAEAAYGAAMEALCRDPGVDGILVHLFSGGFNLNPDLAAISRAVRASGKPVMAWLLGERTSARSSQIKAQEHGIPVFREMHRSVECMAAVFGHHQLRVQRNPELPRQAALALGPEHLALLEETGGRLDEYQAKRILAGCEIPVVEEQIAESAERVADFARAHGFPLVLKGLVPGEAHKTETGRVRLNLHSPAAAQEAYFELERSMSEEGRVLVQPQLEGEIELIAGLIQDPQFGPCVMCGLGGVFAEVLEDVAFAVAPLSESEALALLGRLKSRQVLDGFRGAPPADKQALARILVALGDLGAAYPRIREIDINPLILVRGRPVAVDAFIRLAD